MGGNYGIRKSKLDNLLKNCVSLGAGSQGEVFWIIILNKFIKYFIVIF